MKNYGFFKFIFEGFLLLLGHPFISRNIMHGSAIDLRNTKYLPISSSESVISHYELHPNKYNL